MQKLAVGRFDVIETPATTAIFIVLGIGAMKRSWKFIGVGVAMVSLVAVIAWITIPTIGSTKKQANETSAIQSLRAIVQAQYQYESNFPAVGYAHTLTSLGGDSKSGPPSPDAAHILDSDLSAGAKSGYIFTITDWNGVTINGTKLITRYTVTAVPHIVGKTGNRGFCSDESGTLKADPTGGENCTQTVQ